MVPRMNYWCRTTSPTSLLPAAKYFDQLVLDTFTQRLNLNSIPDVARYQLSMPVRDGGFGLTSMVIVSPAAWYSGFLQAFCKISPMIASVDDLKEEIPFVQTLLNCFNYFTKLKFPKNSPVSLDLKQFWMDRENNKRPRGTQRLIMSIIYKERATALLQEYPRNSSTRARLTAVTAPYSGSWLTTAPIDPLFHLLDAHFALATRLRLGIPLFDNIKKCVCGATMSQDLLHSFKCEPYYSA